MNNDCIQRFDSNSVAGFFSDGELYTSANEVTINDANEAVLGSLTRLGDGSNGGALTAGNADPADTYSHFLVEQGENILLAYACRKRRRR